MTGRSAQMGHEARTGSAARAGSPEPPRGAGRRVALALKRLVDVCVAAFGLAALSPLVVVLIVLQLVVHGWPPFFTQERPGLHGRPFRMVKLRTMTNARGPDGALLPDAQRLTRLGALLRRTSLDELPELWNVLVGDMSLVGPRPLLMQYLERYTPEQARRHEMKPGITGLAQVSGRNLLTWEDRFRLDVAYVDGWSPWLDLKILWRTARVVLGREGVSADGHVTMPEFMGSAPERAPQGADLAAANARGTR